MARILVVDDEGGVRSYLHLALARDGHDVEVAADAQTALEQLKRSAFEAHGGNRRLTAEQLGIGLRTLYSKLKLYQS